MNRKSFILASISSLVSAVSGMLLLQNCSKSDEPAPSTPAPDCSENGAKHSSISLNHGHTLTISKEDVLAGLAKSYIITGTASHPHEVALTVDHFNKLKNNEIITVASSVNSDHSHDVTVKCA